MLSSPALCVGLLVVATMSAIAKAEPAAPKPVEAPWRQQADRWHDQVYAWVQRQLQDLDGVLASKGVTPNAGDRLRATDETESRSPFRLELDLSVGDFAFRSALSSAARFDIDLQLPQLERRLRVFLTTDDVSETLSDAAEEWRAGLRLQAFQDADLELGIKLDTPPIAFAAVRWGRELRQGPWWIHPFAKVFIDSEQGFGASSALVIDHWDEGFLWRSSSSLLGLPRDSRFLWGQSWVVAQTHEVLYAGRPLTRVGSRDIVDGWGLELGVGGEGARMLERELALFYKQPLQSDWLFISVRPFWRSTRRLTIGSRWERDIGVSVGLDLLFWDLAGQRSVALK